MELPEVSLKRNLCPGTLAKSVCSSYASPVTVCLVKSKLGQLQLLLAVGFASLFLGASIAASPAVGFNFVGQYMTPPPMGEIR